MGLSKKQKQNAERLKKALEDYDETTEVLQTARDLGTAAREGNEEELDRLSRKVQRRGWLK
jgi:septation ring formation regulator EzrA